VIINKFSICDIIVFESNPDYSCNTYPVFLELRKRLPKYRMVWKVHKGTPCIQEANDVIYIDSYTLLNKIKKTYYCYLAKAFVSCNSYWGKYRKGQINLFLSHGCKTKNTRDIYNPGSAVDYINMQSHFFDKVTCYGYRAVQSQLVYLGYPRCDWFFVKNQISRQLMEIGVNGDYLIWLPTFRKSKNISWTVNSKKYESLGIPLIYSPEKLNECNDFLKERGLHIIYKPHPVQDVARLTKVTLSHIHIIKDETLATIGLQLYQVIAESKGLITDYSSVYFDYLLLDRPIATTIDDLEQWKSKDGFAFDIESMYKASTEQIASLEELYYFIQEVIIEGKDSKRIARQEIRNKTILFQDGHSAQRVADFILEKIGGKCETCIQGILFI